MVNKAKDLVMWEDTLERSITEAQRAIYAKDWQAAVNMLELAVASAKQLKKHAQKD